MVRIAKAKRLLSVAFRLFALMLGLLLFVFPFSFGSSNTQAFQQQSGRDRGVIRIDGSEDKLYDESHALVIGVSKYTNGWHSLEGVKQDVEEVSRILEKHGFRVKRVIDPTRAKFEQEMSEFIYQHGQSKNNRLLVYFAGHGYTVKSGGREEGYIVPADAPNPVLGAIAAEFRRAAISLRAIDIYAHEIESKHALFVFDSCFAGTIFEVQRGSVSAGIQQKANGLVRQFITSGSADEMVPDPSIFCKKFVDGLNGEADTNNDGFITGIELGEFLYNAVTNAVGRNKQTPQHGKITDPNLNKGDFVFESPKRKPPEPPRIIAEQTAKLEELKAANAKLAEERAALKRESDEREAQARARASEEAYWRAIENNNNAHDFDEYLRKYGANAIFTDAAKIKIRRLKSKSDLSGKPVAELLGLAENYMRRADYREAISAADEAIQVEPQNAIAYWLRGGSYDELDLDTQEEMAHSNAEAVFRFVGTPRNAREFVARCWAYSLKEEHERAIKDCTEALQLEPKNVWAYLYRGIVYREKKEHDKAIADLSKGIEIDPKFVMAYDNRGITYRRKKNYDLAVADYTKGLSINPKVANLLNNRAFAVLYKEGIFTGYIDHLTGDIRQDPEYKQYFNTNKTQSDSSVGYNSAIADLTDAIRIEPNTYTMYGNRGQAYLFKNEYDLAITDLNEAIHLAPKAAWIFNARGNSYLGREEYDRAIADYNEAIKLDPKFSLAYINRGIAYTNKEELDRAIGDLNKGLDLNADISEVIYILRGDLFTVKKEYDRAITDYNDAIDLNSEVALAYRKRAAVYIEKKEYDRSMADLSSAIRLDPKSYQSYVLRGDVYVEKKELNKAVSDYSEAIKLNAEDVGIYNKRAQLYRKLGNSKLAQADENKAKELKGESPAASESDFTIPPEVKQKYPDLVPLILESASMNKSERQYWFSIIPVMTMDQINRLREILTTEKTKLKAIDKKYERQLREAGDKVGKPDQQKDEKKKDKP